MYRTGRPPDCGHHTRFSGQCLPRRLLILTNPSESGEVAVVEARDRDIRFLKKFFPVLMGSTKPVFGHLA
jgi:hypothetical protein